MNADIEGEDQNSWRFVPWSNCAICGKNRVLLNFKKAHAKGSELSGTAPWKTEIDMILPICVHQRYLRLKSRERLSWFALLRFARRPATRQRRRRDAEIRSGKFSSFCSKR